MLRRVAVSLLSAAATAFAGPIPAHLLPADAQWVVHLDLDALHAGPGAELLSRMSQTLALEAESPKEAETVTTLIQQVHGVTVFARPGSDKPAMIIETRQSPADLLATFGPQVIDQGDGRQVISWKGGNGSDFVGLAMRDADGTHRLILADNAGALRAAIGPAQAEQVATFTLPQGTPVVYAEMANIAPLLGEQPSAILTRVKGVRMEVLNPQADQNPLRLQLAGHITARDAEAARLIQQTASGMLAMMQLKQPETRAEQVSSIMLAGATVELGEANHVTFSLSLPLDLAEPQIKLDLRGGEGERTLNIEMNYKANPATQPANPATQPADAQHR